MHIVTDQALLNLLVVRLTPDLLKESSVKARQGIPFIIIVVLDILMRNRLVVSSSIPVIEILGPDRLSN